MAHHPFFVFSRFLILAGLIALPALAIAAPSVQPPVVNPSFVLVAQSTALTVTAYVKGDATNPVIATGVNLLRLDATGKVLATLGRMWDDGTHGDAVAGDGIFTLIATVNESVAGDIRLQISAAFYKLLSRVKSSVALVPAVEKITFVPQTPADPSSDRIVYDPVNNVPTAIRDEILLRLNLSSPWDSVSPGISALGGIVIGSIPVLNLIQVRFPNVTQQSELDAIIIKLDASGAFDLVVQTWLETPRKTPNDPLWLNLWQLDKNNPTGDNWAYDFIDLPRAWDITTGSKDVKIGINEVGAIQLDHIDLLPNVTKTYNNIPLVSKDHGTAVAGIVGAKGSNLEGITGVMWDVSLVLHPLTITQTFANGLPWTTVWGQIDSWTSLINDGVRVINYSAGKDHSNALQAEKVRKAYKPFFDSPEAKKTLFVFAAGETYGVDDSWSTPSSLSAFYPNVISVTEVSQVSNVPSLGFLGGGLPADYNVGNIDVAAPGSGFTVITPQSTYCVLGFPPCPNGGTSFAAPMVSGLAGLLFSVRPDATPSQVKQWIISGSKNGGWQIKTVQGHKVGDGILQSFYAINAYESLRLALATLNTGRLNDTGITASQCYMAGSDTLVACNSTGAIALSNAQDGMVGRDASEASNNPADGKLGFSFAAVEGGCVQDNVTGLMWEVKTTDGGLRDRNKMYYNFGYAYAEAVNATNLCGHNDWRLPTVDELQSIVDYGVAYPGPTVDATWFPNTQESWYWSSTLFFGSSNVAWGVYFGNGQVGSHNRLSYMFVRLVRAGQ